MCATVPVMQGIGFVELRECGSRRCIYVNPRHVLEVEPAEDYEGLKSCFLVYAAPDRSSRRVFRSADEVARRLSGGTPQ